MIITKVLLLAAIAGCSLATLPSLSPPPQPVSQNLAEAEPEVVLDRLEHPWGMAWLPDQSLLITERPGRLRLVRQGKLEPQPIPGLPPILALGQGGLLDIALHPQFSQNRWLYFTYAHGTPDANRTRVARAKFDGKRLQNLEVIFESPQTKSGGQHFGSRLLWLPDQTLLVSIGDGGNPPLKLGSDLIRTQAQNRRSALGKIVRLQDDGRVPPNNPWRQDVQSLPQLWSYGHRNIQGLAYDAQRKQVWSTEHGSRGGDELNLIKPGQNYGWPLVTHSEEYFGGQISNLRSAPGKQDPKLVWQQAIAPSGLAVVNGVIYAGGLVSRDIRRLELDPQGKIIRQTSIPIGQRVRDLKFHQGYLYVLTDSAQGQLLRLPLQ
ncbi:MAG: PQQ-dependent sugar dehydrogenase [Pseudanabaenaceae cyanobacterium bins.68]|nr:PQQ-dependent sugar dehydrogenase [Pseudanabaenaceae cyanobacterium bins.68]